MAETDLLKDLLSKFTLAAPLNGPGDDAAVVALDHCVVSTDLAIEGVHFDLGFSTVAEAASKALRRNLSDLAAMGARPHSFLLALGLPKTQGSAMIGHIADGLLEVMEEEPIGLIGGDLGAAPGLTFAITVIGVCDGKPIARSGAEPGHLVAVTGKLGGAAAGWEAWNARRWDILDSYPSLRDRHVKGVERVRFASEAASLLSAGIDLSDGIAIDARRLAEASGVGLRLDLSKVPVDDGVEFVEKELGLEGLAWTGGDDYEMFVTFEEKNEEHIRSLAGSSGLTVIGEVDHGDAVLDTQGRLIQGGFEHGL